MLPSYIKNWQEIPNAAIAQESCTREVKSNIAPRIYNLRIQLSSTAEFRPPHDFYGLTVPISRTPRYRTQKALRNGSYVFYQENLFSTLQNMRTNKHADD